MEVSTARRSFPDATAQTLEEVFADDALRGEFITLAADDGTFLQAGGEGHGPYRLEYKEAGKQFQAAVPLTRQEVKEAFLDYLRGGSDWRAGRDWKELPMRQGCSQPAAALLLLLLGAILPFLR
jgi:hypothetical protein